LQLCALQQIELQAPLPHPTVHWLDAGPSHVTPLVHAFVSHEMCESSVVALTLLRHPPGPQVMRHESLAVQVMLLVHAFAPQFTMQTLPPHLMSLVHAPSLHSMSQLPAPLQSMLLVQPPGPHCTWQTTFGGHVTLDEHLLPLQSMTQLPLTHVPPGHDACVQGAPERAGPPPPVDGDDEPQAAARTRQTAAPAAVATCATRSFMG
jgi:hypothetical protein